MTQNKGLFTATLIATILTTQAALAGPVPPIPDPPREYRAVWCATVNRIDWPPVAGTNPSQVAQQKSRLLAHLQMMVNANMNAMYFQVRPEADAIYNSTIEPWSHYLTGSQFIASTWDPLEYLVEEAHKRGIEVHAWINPYRASTSTNISGKASSHITKLRSDLIIRHGSQLYIDPGKQDSIDWIVNVVEDIVSRYNVDGVVFDDYFYPAQNFADEATFAAYQNNGGTMDIHDWRRDNVDRLIETTYNSIKAIRNTCQFSVGPFGIWRPGNPPGISGNDYYATHYCDTRKWLQNGWVDSLSPQLYWPTDSPNQTFGPLINWWVAQNPDRHVLASTATYRVGDSDFDTYGNVWSNKTAQEIVDQINLVRNANGVGHVHFSVRWLTDDPLNKNVRMTLQNGLYKEQALRPISWWLDNTPPPAPNASISQPYSNPPRRMIQFSQNPGDEPARYWVIYTYNGNQWNWHVVPGQLTQYSVFEPVQEFAVSAVDATGNESDRSGFTSVSNWTLY